MSNTYLNGIYQSKRNELIEIEQIKNLNKQELLEHLKNLNYGQGATYLSIDQVLAYEMKNVRTELENLSQDNILGDMFFFKDDLANLKIVFKSIFYDVKIDEYNIVSKYSKDDLIEFFLNSNDLFIKAEDLEIMLEIKSVVGETIKDKLENIEKLYFNYVYSQVKKKLPALIDYFKTINFNQNLLTFLKLRKRGEEKEVLKDLLLPQNNFPESYWLELFDLPNEQLVEKLNATYFGKLKEGLEHFFITNNTNVLEKILTEILTEDSFRLSYKINTLGPVLNYLNLKVNEVNNIRRLYYENK